MIVFFIMNNFDFLVIQIFRLVLYNGNKIKEITIEEVIICYKIIIETDLVSRQLKQKCEKRYLLTQI